MSSPTTKYQRLLLTGAAGQLGTALRPMLRANCVTLRLSDITSAGIANLPAAPLAQSSHSAGAAAAADEEWVQCDLADSVAVDALIAGCDAIVHFGMSTGDCNLSASTV